MIKNITSEFKVRIIYVKQDNVVLLRDFTNYKAYYIIGLVNDKQLVFIKLYFFNAAGKVMMLSENKTNCRGTSEIAYVIVYDKCLRPISSI